MAIPLDEQIRIEAPVARAWALRVDPAQVVRCPPGASLEGLEDERAFLGGVAVESGAIHTRHRGRVRLEALDAAAHTRRARRGATRACRALDGASVARPERAARPRS